ncbi:MAG: hypothetical protein HY905_16965 [Deltaproteobacteria bacterium]|nr:hypothetical protein [Deltaproteobacteria bacterium]
MDVSVPRLPAGEILKQLAELFALPASDRHVYCVFGPYPALRPFQRKLREQVELGNLNRRGTVEYVSVNRALVRQLKDAGTYDRAVRLADDRRDDELRRLVSAAFRELVTRRIEPDSVAGLVLADFELLYAHELGEHDVSLARQVAINGKRVCLVVPGTMRDSRLWIFDEDQESRRQFPEALVFRNSGWVFELAEEG